MTNLDERIAQFENMAAADPDNEMAHFSWAAPTCKLAEPPKPPEASSGVSSSTPR